MVTINQNENIILCRLYSRQKTGVAYVSAPVNLTEHLHQAESHDGKVLFASGAGVKANLEGYVTANKLVIWARLENMAIIGDITDFGIDGYDPDTWPADDPYQRPALWRAQIARFWWKLDNVQPFEMRPEEWRWIEPNGQPHGKDFTSAAGNAAMILQHI